MTGRSIHSVPTKGDTKLLTGTLLIISGFSIFFKCQINNKVPAKYLLKIPPHLICVATLPCETLMSENERQLQTNAVIDEEFQSIVATYLRCGRICSNHIKTGLLLSLPVIF